ncbi:MAG TPA: alpha-L-arabinofuranosidase C-terminal domain-containing protein [Vicinamibacterales bacterium]
MQHSECRKGRRLHFLISAFCILHSAFLLSSSQRAEPLTATIAIDAGRVEGPIGPLLYGQFLEFMYEGVKYGLHAELLRNRGFDEAPDAIGLSRYWERYPDDRNDDYGLAFGSDDTTAYPERPAAEGIVANRSLRLVLRPAVIERHGVYQPGIPIRRGIEYAGSVWIRSKDFKGSITASLEADVSGGPVYDEVRVADLTGDGVWTRHTFVLRPRADDAQARFALLFSGTGTLWLDQASLVPGDAVDGVRADVFARVKALRPAFLRWPGGNVAQDYRWAWGVGPRDERPTWINLSWKNEWEPGDFGTDEFVRFARAVGAEPSITVNVEGRGATVEEAAAWVEYCNGPASSRYGVMRARNGHPEPYGVKYWEIGNEIWGDWVRGHSDAATYARNLTRYVEAMRAVDPSIRVIAVGDNDMTWNRTVLTQAGAPFDYLAIHHYYGRRQIQGDLRNLMARPLYYERFYAELEALLRALPEDRRPALAINEWGLDLPESQQYSILSALYGARLMNVFERRSDLVAMSAVSDLVNGWPGGIIQASRHGLFVTPIYLVNQLYATHVGSDRLSVRVEGPTFSTSREGDAVPVVDAVASRTADGRRIFLKVVNTDLERPVRAQVRLTGARVQPRAEVQRVVADSVHATAGFSAPDAVRITRIPIKAGASFGLELPKHSVSVLTLMVR